MTGDGMKWEDPSPSSHGSQGHWEQVAAELRAHPKRWAVIREGPIREWEACRQLAVRIRSAKLTAFRPKGAFEAAIRRSTNDDTVKVYTRYVGDGAS